MIYIAVDDHEFAIIGDTAIHDRVGEDFWGGDAGGNGFVFRQDMLVDGLIAGIQQVGEQLQYFFST